ncbi:MAG: GatB/YqeY domain-containing protein [Proteobacteria bacterium]|nr:GatB/YqeY domain-containing protein [Pseudomonadota bacterium]
MSIKEQIAGDVKSAMKAREKLKLETLRMTLAAIKNKEIEKKAELDDRGAVALISTLVKQRREAAGMYRDAGRDELADKEEEEITFLKGYLPKELSREDLIAAVDAVIEESGASSMADMGNVMKGVMAKVGGQAEGRMVNEVVKERLSR